MQTFLNRPRGTRYSRSSVVWVVVRGSLDTTGRITALPYFTNILIYFRVNIFAHR